MPFAAGAVAAVVQEAAPVAEKGSVAAGKVAVDGAAVAVVLRSAVYAAAGCPNSSFCVG